MLDWLFKMKPPPEPPSLDRVWLDLATRDQAIVRAAQAGPLDVIAFFPETLDRVRKVVERAGAQARFSLADRIHVAGPAILVAERHPLPDENRALLERLAISAPGVVPVFFSAIDDPMMLRFGGDRLAGLMKQLGMAPDEPVEHTLVTKALANAREKIAAKVTVASSARSMEEWLLLNLGPPR